MDHLDRDDDGGVARHELDPAPAAVAHPGQVVAREPDAGQHVDLPVALPRGVVDLQHRDRAEDAEVVDEDVDVGERGEQLLRALGGGDVGGDARDARAGELAAQLLHHAVHARPVAPVDDGVRAAAREPRHDRAPDALGRSADEGRAAAEVDLHVFEANGAQCRAA
jgi:hypothetical protein